MDGYNKRKRKPLIESDYSDLVHSQEEEEEDYNNMKKKQRTGEVQMDDFFSVLLPDELILEFLSRLPMKSVMKFSSVSKYLYNSIHKDVYFANSHLINYAQKHPFLVFYIINVNYGTRDQPILYKNLFHIKGADEIQNDHDNLVDFGKTIKADCTHNCKGEFVGYCNGLVCFTRSVSAISCIDVWNFTTYELLRIYPPVIEHQGKGFNYSLLYYGFGFDSFRKEYKMVFIVRMLYTMSHKCWVYRFGTKSSWEEISAPEVSRDPRSSHQSEDMSSSIFRAATFTSYGGTGGGGALFWKTTNPRLILLFDLYHAKFQYIQFPAGGGNRSPVTDDIRIFEYKGYLGVATLEKKVPVAGSRSRVNKLEKVHLNILKSYKDDQVWVKETVDLSPYQIPYPGLHCRLVSFCDQILLYWMEPRRFLFFNLHKKCQKVVRNLASCILQKTSLRDLIPPDYRLHCEVENIFSLKTLLPKRAQRCDSAALDAIVKKGFGHIWSLKEPKTVGGYFVPYGQSKAKEYFVFGD